MRTINLRKKKCDIHSFFFLLWHFGRFEIDCGVHMAFNMVIILTGKISCILFSTYSYANDIVLASLEFFYIEKYF